MNIHIEAAIAERTLLQDEFNGYKTALNDEDFNEAFPPTEMEITRALLRMHLLDESIKYLDKCIIDGLSKSNLDIKTPLQIN